MVGSKVIRSALYYICELTNERIGYISFGEILLYIKKKKVKTQHTKVSLPQRVHKFKVRNNEIGITNFSFHFDLNCFIPLTGKMPPKMF